MQIDPRLVTTPVGAALGVLVARRILDKKDHTLKNMLIGGGLGGGAGFLAGQFIKGEPGDISTPKGYLRYIQRQMPEGMPSKQEVEAVHNIKPIYGNIHPTKTGFMGLNKFRRKSMEPIAGTHESAQVYKTRALLGRKLSKYPNISEQSRRVFKDYSERMERNYKEMANKRTSDTLRSPIDSLGTLVSTLTGN